MLAADPTLLHRLEELLPSMLTNPATARIVGLLLLGFVALYVVGSILHLPPLVIRKAKLEYPRPAIMVRQLIAAPLELLGAAGIIYFVLPAHLEPSFIVVLAVFLASFSAALVSHAPGGLGVFELVFLTAMPDIPKADVLAALIIFRLFYLLIPFAPVADRGRACSSGRGWPRPGADGWRRRRAVPPPPSDPHPINEDVLAAAALRPVDAARHRAARLLHSLSLCGSVEPLDYPALPPLFEAARPRFSRPSLAAIESHSRRSQRHPARGGALPVSIRTGFRASTRRRPMRSFGPGEAARGSSRSAPAIRPASWLRRCGTGRLPRGSPASIPRRGRA